MKIRLSLLAVAVLGCAAAPLHAQDAAAAPGLLVVASAPDGTVLGLDSVSIAHIGQEMYGFTAVYRFPPEAAQRNGFDRLLEAQEVDCAGNRQMALWKQAYRGDVLLPVADRAAGNTGDWVAAPEAELPLLQAICGTLQRSWAASLPLEYELSAVEEQPSLANAGEVQRDLAHEFPRVLQDAGVSGIVTLRMRVKPDGHVDAGSVQVEHTSDPGFVGAARRVAAQMRFTPARVKGQPVAVWVTLPVTFQLIGNPNATVRNDADPSANPRAPQPPGGSPSLCSNVLVCPPHP